MHSTRRMIRRRSAQPRGYIPLPGEKLLYEERPALVVFALPVLFLALAVLTIMVGAFDIALVCVTAGIVAGAFSGASYFGTRFAVTTERICARDGFLGRDFRSIYIR